jgi:hypothetical protein
MIKTFRSNEANSFRFSLTQGFITFPQPPQSHILLAHLFFTQIWQNPTIFFFFFLKITFIVHFLFDYNVIFQPVWNTQPIQIPVWHWKFFLAFLAVYLGWVSCSCNFTKWWLRLLLKFQNCASPFLLLYCY